MNRFMPEHGAPKTMTYLPENEPELMMILKRERFKRSYHATAGNLEEYLDKLEKTTLREKLKRAKTVVSTQEVSSHMVLVLTPADIFEQKEENARLYEALDSLPEKQRNRITSHFLFGMSLSDIAKSEGTGVSSVHEGIQRGLRRLKKILEKMNTDPENYHQK